VVGNGSANLADLLALITYGEGMDGGETWRSEYLNRVPVKIQAGRVLVHNRVRPPASDAVPGIDGFMAWVLHPVAPGPPEIGMLEACDCGWMPNLGPHYVFPDQPLEDAVVDLGDEDLVGSSQHIFVNPDVHMPSSMVFKCISEALSENLPDDAVIEAVQVSPDQSTITIWTSTPSAVIGRRGSVAQRINISLKSSLGKQVLVLVAAVSDPPDNDLFGGVREPREPQPESPSGAAHLDPPGGGR
jgi:hypothetical protein